MWSGVCECRNIESATHSARHIVHRICPNISYWARSLVEVGSGEVGRRAGRPGQASVVGEGHQLGRVGRTDGDDGGATADAGILLF